MAKYHTDVLGIYRVNAIQTQHVVQFFSDNVEPRMFIKFIQIWLYQIMELVG